MRISNAFHTYELVFVFLINYLKTSAAWGKGKYFSEYEYPEIQLLFSAKEEVNGEGIKTGISGSVHNKPDFFPVLNSDENSFIQVSERKKSSKGQILKPWMRGPYAEGIDNEKTSNNDEKKVSNAKELKSSEEMKLPKNNPAIGTAPLEVEERQFWQRGDKHRKRFNGIVNTDLGNELEQRKIKYRKRVKIQNHNRISSIRGDANKRFKNQAVNAWHENCEVLPPYDGSDTANEPKKRKNIELPNVNDKLYSPSRILPEYEGNIQEYDELNGVVNKNEVMAANNQPLTTSEVSQTKEEVTATIQVNKNIAITNDRTVTNEPIKLESTQAKVTIGNQGIVSNEMTFVNKVQSPVTENVRFATGVSPSTHSTSSLLPIQEKNLNINILKQNVSQANERLNKETGILPRQSNRAEQENHPLLAKPPVKIAGTLMDKHSEDDNEVNIEEKGTKMVKVEQMNPIIHSSTALPPIGHSAGLQNNVPNNEGEGVGNNVFFVKTYYPSPKKKRNINENKTVNTQEVIREKTAYVVPSKIIVDNKTSEMGSHSQLVNRSIGFDNDEISESRNRFTKPQYYALSKSNSAVRMVNNLMAKLKPGNFIKKKKIHDEKFNDSYKRNAPSTYEQVYDSGYDYYRSKEGKKKGDPIRAYYDYENDYDLDYDKDYPRVIHLNNTGLAAEKELSEYDGKSYSNNFPKSKTKGKRKKYRKVEETYTDIFAHPLSLDDPELQIVRDDDDELVKRRMHHKNFANRRHREKFADKEFPQYQNDKPAEVESLPRSHLKKKKEEHPRLYKVTKKQAIYENEVSDKKIH